MARPSRRRSGGFFIIFGTRTRISGDGSAAVNTTCPHCRRPAMLQGKKVREWFTLYFIPVFPMSSGERFTQCSVCKAQFGIPIDEFSRLANANPDTQGGFPAAIALFNEMRETPNDSAKLHRLMKMYVALNEPREAISAAASYPAALQASDACLALLGQIYQKIGQRDDALRYVSAALALNPSNADALAVQEDLLAQRPPVVAAAQ